VASGADARVMTLAQIDDYAVRHPEQTNPQTARRAGGNKEQAA
jgi:hypothetical protein